MSDLEFSLGQSVLIEVQNASLDDAICSFLQQRVYKSKTVHEIPNRTRLEKQWTKDIQDLSQDYTQYTSLKIQSKISY